MKKTILHIILVVALLLILASGFMFFKNQKKFDTSALTAVPLNSEIILKVHSIKNLHSALISKKGMFKEFKESGVFDDFLKLYDLVDSLVDVKDLYLDIDKSITCATKLVGKNKLDMLYLVELKNIKELKPILQLTKDCLPKYRMKQKKYSGENIYMYTYKSNRYNMALVDGIFLMSKSVIFIEESIRQIKSKNNLLNKSSFVAVSKTVDESADIHVFINNSNISAFTKLWAAPSCFSFLSKINNWGNWTGLDVDFTDYTLSFNGFSSSSHNDFELFDVLSHQESVETTLLDFVPAGTSTFSLFALSNLNRYREDMIKYRGKISMLNKYRRSIVELDKTFKCKFEEKFYSFFSGESVCLSMSINSLDVNANKISIFKSIGKEKLSRVMMGMLSGFAEKKDRSIKHYETTVKIGGDLSYKLYKMPYNDLAYRIMGDVFYKAPTNYFVVVGNNLVFGGSIKVLSDYLHSLSLNKSIVDASNFKLSNKKFSNKGNFFFYANTYSSLSLLKSFFNPKMQRIVSKNKDSFYKFHSIGYQLSSANAMVYSNIFVLYANELEQKPQTVWESGLEGNVVIKPSIVKNHKTNETETLIQDDKNNVYLINSLGRILWKLPIDARINSDIYQVDAYKNRKLQYMFSTSNKIYLVDRNGNNVENFPVRLKSPTKYGLSVFDYDSNRTYRIIVPSINKKVYLYDINGNIVKGWKFKESENEICSKVSHKRVNTKDYIVFKDKFKVYILNRKGMSTAKSKYLKLSKSDISFFEGKKAYMLVTDIMATVYKIDFHGKVSKLKTTKNISERHLFTATDLDNDSKPDFIFADGKKLIAFSGSNKIIDIKIAGEIKITPSIYSFSSRQKMIGFIDKSNSLAYLIDKKGHNYPGFPVLGNNAFSITFMRGKGSGFYMFVGSSDGGLYKYKVQK